MSKVVIKSSRIREISPGIGWVKVYVGEDLWIIYKFIVWSVTVKE